MGWLKELFKRLRKDISSEGSLETHISRFLFQYRNTPHTTTGVSLAELLLGQRPRTLGGT